VVLRENEAISVSARPSWWRRVLARILEYFTLRRAFEHAQRVSSERRATLRAEADQALEKRDAAALLASRGVRAEAIALAIECARLVGGCFEELSQNGRELSPRERRLLAALERNRGELEPPPQRDARVTRAHTIALRAMLHDELAVEAPLREALYDRRGLLRLRLQRALLVMLVVLSPLGAVAFVRVSFLGPKARASSVLDDQYAVDRILDGDPQTEWVSRGGDKDKEWLELRFRKRTVHTIRILNGDTLPDRATKDYEVQFFEHQDSRGTVSGRTFHRQVPAEWQTIDVRGITCDRILIDISSHYGEGAAIAEVTLD
jgi:hypothetical protein